MTMPKPTLDLAGLKTSATEFTGTLSAQTIPELFGTTDGKAVGTFVEHGFQSYLQERFSHTPGNSASGVDFPDLGADLKVTSIRQPQSSCPFKNAEQKVYGLGYHLLVFVYEKEDLHDKMTARLNIRHCVFLHRDRTADFQTTRGIREILQREGNGADIMAFLSDRNLPLDEIGLESLAGRIIASPPAQGYLTISNALQWRLQYGRAIQFADDDGRGGVEELR